MFGLENLKIKKEKQTSKTFESKNYANYEIPLNTLFYVIKNGNEINLKVTNNDTYEDGMILALGRTLDLDGIFVQISQWADWTITITLFNEGEQLKVAESLIPNERINWNDESNPIDYCPNLKWIERGNWCKVIYHKVNSLKFEIDNKRSKIAEELAKEKAKERAIEEERNVNKRLIFNNIWKQI